jgi:ubiquinone/menaquinone biosynthesis C-methylase UbiE
VKKIEDAQKYVFRQEPVYSGERQILSELTRPNMKVLDVGCGATGRTARLLKNFNCEVYSIEINKNAVAEFKTRADSNTFYLTAADMRSMPFRADFFDLILIAFHGIDYLLTDPERIKVFREVSRILATNGTLVLNSFNRIGSILTPSNFRSKDGLAWLVNHLITLNFLKPTLIDGNSFELYQSTTRRVIGQVEGATNLTFDYAINPNGSSRNFPLLTLFSTAPYFVFSR